MPAFKAKKNEEPPVAPERPVEPTGHSGPAKKDHPTPTRREAEAARRQRLNPTLSKKEMKARERASRVAQRQREYQTVDATPERQLVRDVVDSRFNIGEIAMPLLLVLMAVTFIPAFLHYATWVIYGMYAFLIVMVLDSVLLWRRIKRMLAERLPDRPRRGLGMYMFNRQMSFRRWRTPAPRVKRGDDV
ncbi:DUF3043 domain-containing protein [Nigerium massiliense]|uniref:DUF3043 domain-containing protein n=1 Tax=Nigerium massiliense TaxID=1522317 RepID=UPI000694EB1A|nr:DUF3043 domain-containing protein [Nigerium massiliense]